MTLANATSPIALGFATAEAPTAKGTPAGAIPKTLEMAASKSPSEPAVCMN
jgi:hypothetical protein